MNTLLYCGGAATGERTVTQGYDLIWLIPKSDIINITCTYHNTI